MPEAGDTSKLRAARIEAARIVRDAVAGSISTEEARAQWPADEGIDPSIDTLAHAYFDHFLPTATRRTPDEDDVAGVLELADLIAEGDPLDPKRLKEFWAWSFSSGPVLLVLAAAVLALLLYLAVRIT